jgi:hypothetical protein
MSTAPRPMSPGRYRILVGAILGLAVVALVVGILVTDTDQTDDAGSSDIVERFIPKPDDEVVRQAELGIDLAPGYDGTIAVNGVEIPEEDQRRVPEQNEVFFTPGEGKAVERLNAGPNCATATVWRAADGRGTANDRTFTWCFEAT